MGHNRNLCGELASSTFCLISILGTLGQIHLLITEPCLCQFLIHRTQVYLFPCSDLVSRIFEPFACTFSRNRHYPQKRIELGKSHQILFLDLYLEQITKLLLAIISYLSYYPDNQLFQCRCKASNSHRSLYLVL